MQVLALKALENEPGSHGLHSSDPLLAANRPGVHGRHSICPVRFWYSPLSHVWHELLLVSFVYVPKAQSSQRVAAIPFANLPTSHTSHGSVDSVPFLLVPGKHGLHSPPPSVWYPAAHLQSKLSADAFSVVVESLGHDVQLEFPLFSPYLPISQSKHSSEEFMAMRGLYLPLSHKVQDADPEMFLY
jgi:hypothetical protein